MSAQHTPLPVIANDRTVRLVALRWSDAKGWRWVFERECYESLAQSYLAIFRADEPSIDFRIAKATGSAA